MDYSGIKIGYHCLLSANVRPGNGTVFGPMSNIYGEGEIGPRTRVGAYTEIGYPRIGSDCKIQAHVFIPKGVTIGDRVFIGPGVVFTNDKYPRATGPWTVEETVVGDDVSIGAAAVVLPGVKIGRGARIAAGTVVAKDVEQDELVQGPAGQARSIPEEWR